MSGCVLGIDVSFRLCECYRRMLCVFWLQCASRAGAREKCEHKESTVVGAGCCSGDGGMRGVGRRRCAKSDRRYAAEADVIMDD